MSEEMNEEQPKLTPESPELIRKRADAEMECYEQMTEIEKQLGVVDPEREQFDAFVERRVSEALEGFANLRALRAALAQPKPEHGDK